MFFWRNLKRSLKYLWPPYLMTRINRLEENHNSAWKKLCNIELEHLHIKEILSPNLVLIRIRVLPLVHMYLALQPKQNWAVKPGKVPWFVRLRF